MHSIIKVFVFCFLIFLGTSPVIAEETGLRFRDGNLEIYSDDLTSHYGMPLGYSDNIPKSELPLLLEVYRNYPKLVPQVLNQRNNNQTWVRIFQELRIDPFFLYPQVDVSEYGPPYGKAWGYYQNKSYQNYDWNDQDLFSLATIKLIEYVEQSAPEQAIKMYKNHPRITLFKGHSKAKVQNKSKKIAKHHNHKGQSKKQKQAVKKQNHQKNNHGKMNKGNQEKGKK